MFACADDEGSDSIPELHILEPENEPTPSNKKNTSVFSGFKKKLGNLKKKLMKKKVKKPSKKRVKESKLVVGKSSPKAWKDMITFEKGRRFQNDDLVAYGAPKCLNKA